MGHSATVKESSHTPYIYAKLHHSPVAEPETRHEGGPASLGGLATALLILGLLIAGSLVIDALT